MNTDIIKRQKTLSITIVSLNLPLSANAQNNELYQSGDNDEAGQNIGPRQASDQDNRITSKDSSILWSYNLLCQNQDDPILNGFCDHVNRNDAKASAQNQYLDNLDKSCIEDESKGSNPDVHNIIKSCFSDRITPSLPNLGTNELKVGVTVFSDLGRTFQVIVKDLATLQSDSFRVTNDALTVKTFEIPIGHPYSVEVGFNPTVTSY
jgi:hypothetical protein